ncbi:MAG: transmembrane sensor [Arenicella sp.]|jgi:transmembrane sensor
MNTIAFPNLRDIEDQATNWIAKIDRGLSVDEQVLLEAWLAETEFHADTLVKCASMWDLLDVLKPISALMPFKDEANMKVSQEQSRFGAPASFSAPATKAWLIAASFMLLIGALIYTNLPISSNSSLLPLAEQASEATPYASHTYKTAVGEISTVSLTDGSTLELNTDSEVRVRFTESKRNIELLRGEVYFDVAKNAAKPFEVKVGQDKVTAIGTAFSIDAGELLDDSRSVLEVIVTHGKVRVISRNRQLPLYLEHGQKAVARDDSFEVSYQSEERSNLAWREGMIVFKGESLTDVVRELNRYTPLKFRLMDPQLKSISVGGFFKTGDLDQLLAVLESNFSVSSEIVGDEILLTKAK